ncbi:MAG: cation transporter [Pirellulaceae bacterium]|nr:cation transporter [Pirellulaceae bacterium]
MSSSTNRMVFQVSGMTCNHCRKAVENAIRNVPGVDAVDVDLDLETAVVHGTADATTISSAVIDAGYEASLDTRA